MATQFASKVIADAPPGELPSVVDDLKLLAEETPALVCDLDKSIAKYNIDQFTIVTVDGKKTIISPFNQAQDLFFDPILGKQFEYDHISKKTVKVSPYSDSSNYDFESLHSCLGKYTNQHFPSTSCYGVFPQPDSTVAIVIVDSKYSPRNFWNGRWRSWYLLDPASGRISGSIEVDVHYFEDGNVRLKTRKEVGIVLPSSSSSGSEKEAVEVISKIAAAESQYQEDINRSFVNLNEGSFKALRRQLPVTRAKMNWGNAMGNYRLGKDIGGV